MVMRCPLDVPLLFFALLKRGTERGWSARFSKADKIQIITLYFIDRPGLASNDLALQKCSRKFMRICTILAACARVRKSAIPQDGKLCRISPGQSMSRRKGATGRSHGCGFGF
jgi:hypothetical protein